LTIAAAYRGDKRNSVRDRFEVASALEHRQLAAKLGGKHPSRNPTEYEQMADGLRREFGHTPEIFGLYAGIVRAIDHGSAGRLATKVLELNPPPVARAQIEIVTSRLGLIGRPLDLPLTDLAGKRVEIGHNSGATVLYVSTSSGAAGSAELFAGLGAKALKARVPKPTGWVYLHLGATPAPLNAAKAKAPFAGTFCTEPKGLASPVARRLKIGSSPCVFVYDKKGRLAGFGRVEELPALLAEAEVRGAAR
jgi:hypothetical protein